MVKFDSSSGGRSGLPSRIRKNNFSRLRKKSSETKDLRTLWKGLRVRSIDSIRIYKIVKFFGLYYKRVGELPEMF